ncbi:MAG: hypothetical protein HC785_29110 [Calothrix sp. CSU_2_0]|nr:hypothetical protein [Calothrix sp. CSU_2_0]
MEQTINNGIKPDGNSTNTGTKKPRKQRYLPGLPIASSAKDTNKGILDVLVNRSPVEFSALENYELFSTVDDGSDPMIKISVSKASRLSDAKPFITGGGRCYRVRLTNYRPQQSQNHNQGDS